MTYQVLVDRLEKTDCKVNTYFLLIYPMFVTDGKSILYAAVFGVN